MPTKRKADNERLRESGMNKKQKEELVNEWYNTCKCQEELTDTVHTFLAGRRKTKNLVHYELGNEKAGYLPIPSAALCHWPLWPRPALPSQLAKGSDQRLLSACAQCRRRADVRG